MEKTGRSFLRVRPSVWHWPARTGICRTYLPNLTRTNTNTPTIYGTGSGGGGKKKQKKKGKKKSPDQTYAATAGGRRGDATPVAAGIKIGGGYCSDSKRRLITILHIRGVVTLVGRSIRRHNNIFVTKNIRSRLLPPPS